ncbi:MAG: hypothetical protein ACKPKO_58300, partial [Candidatus Fonsibacter sp.]
GGLEPILEHNDVQYNPYYTKPPSTHARQIVPLIKNGILYKYRCPTNNQRLVTKREQSITIAIHKLINNASTRFGYIKRAMDSLPEAKKYDVDALLEKARSEVEYIAKNRVDASAAKTIANKLTVTHIVEYIVHINNKKKTTNNNKHHKNNKLRQIHHKRTKVPMQG